MEAVVVGVARGERFDGTPFTDLGLANVPALAGVADLLDAILAA